MRIAIIRLSALGDIVCSLPVLAALHHERPEAEISWVVEDRFANLLEGHPWVHELVVFPRQKLKKLWRERDFAGIRLEVAAYKNHLRALNFDWVIDLQGNLKSGVQSFLTGGRRRVGFDWVNSREGNWLFSNRRIKPLGDHVIERNLSLLRPLGVDPKLYPFEVHSPKSVIERVDKLWDEFNLRGKRIALVHSGVSAKYGNKRWLPSRIAGLGDRLGSDEGYTVLLTTGPGEEELVKYVRSMMCTIPVLLPTLSYRLLFEVVSRVDCMVGGDTGPTHMATVAGTPTVMFFGPTGGDYAGPEVFGGRSVAFDKVFCAPCYRRECFDPVCMENLSVDKVLGEVKLLANRGAKVVGAF